MQKSNLISKENVMTLADCVAMGERPLADLIELTQSINQVRIVIERAGDVLYESTQHNLRTNKGVDQQSQAMGDGAGDSGTSSTAPTSTTFTCDGKSYTTDQWVGKTVRVGTTYGVILSNTSTVLTVDKWYNAASPGGAAASTPSAGDYVIGPGTSPATWIAVTTNGTAPAASDTTLTSEINSGGLARAVATYSHTASATSYKQTKVFTATATHTGVQKAGMFNASSGGVMWFENTFTSVTLQSGDTLTVEWTVNV